MSIYAIDVKLENGQEYSMKEYEDKVVLVVNTATKCGYTPQFEELELLYKKYKDDGLVILGFPTNQFKQELDTAEAAAEQCRLTYGVSFPMHELVSVNGAQEHELFKYLKSNSKGFLGSSIKWNFTKFLVDRDGNVVERFGSKDKPLSFEDRIKELLTKN